MRKWLLLATILVASLARAQVVAVTANLTAQDSGACTTANACLVGNVAQGYASSVIQLSGTWSGTAQFEAATTLNGPFTAIAGIPVSAPSNSAVTSSAANGAWRFNVSSVNFIRVRVSAYSSGTVAAAISVSPATSYSGSSSGSSGSGVSSFSGDGALACNNTSTGAVTFALCANPVLPDGTTATTQTAGDDTSKVATDAFVLANQEAFGGITNTGPLPLVLNGNFESDNVLPPPGWLPNPNATLSYETASPYEGLQTLKMVSDGISGAVTFPTNTTDAQPGDIFYIAGAMKSDGTVTANLIINFVDKNDTAIGANCGPTTASTSYVYLSAYCTAPANTVFMEVSLGSTPFSTVGTTWFDAISVYKINQPSYGQPLDCSQYYTTDGALAIATCFQELYAKNTVSGIANAANIPPGAWSVNPYTAATNIPASGTLMLPCGTITVAVPLVKHGDWSQIGCSSRGVDGQVGTTIKAASTFQPTYTNGTITVGSPGAGETVTGSGTTWVTKMTGCNFYGSNGATNSTFGIITAASTTSLTLGFGTNLGTGAPAASSYTIACGVGVNGSGLTVSAGDEYGTGDTNINYDCNNIAGAIGLVNWFGNQNVGATNVGIHNCTNIGLDLENQIQNSGPWSVTVSMGSGTGCANSIPIVVHANQNPFKGITNSNISKGSCASSPPIGIDVAENGTVITGLDAANVGVAIMAGNNTTCPVACAMPGRQTSGFDFENIYAESTVTTAVESNNFYGTAQGWQVKNIIAPAGGTLIDSANGCTETNTRLGSYIASVTGAINTSTSNITGCLAPGSGPGIGYPPAGIANSTGAAWAASYHVGTSANSLVQLNGASQLPAVSAANLTNFPTFNQSTTGTAANLSGTPTLPNGTAAFTQGAGDATTKLATDSFVSTAVGNAIPLALFTNKNLASPVSVTGSTLTTVDSVSATMPSTGGPYRVLVTYAYFNSGGVNVECYVTDGTNNWALWEQATTSNITTCVGSQWSPTTYAAGATPTFTVKEYNTGSATVETVGNLTGSVPSSMQISIFASN